MSSRSGGVCILILLSLVVTPAFAAVDDPPATASQVFSRIREKALQKSYELRIAEATELQTSAARYTAWTLWVPRVDLSLSHSRVRDYSIITSGAIGQIGFNITPSAVQLARWDLDVSMPIYRRSVHLGIEQAAAQDELSEYQLISRRTELDWRLRQLVGNYLLQSYKEATLQNSIELAKTNRREAELRFELGQRTKVDVLKSRANVISLDSKRVQFRQQRVAALNELREYVGISAQELLDTGIDSLLRSEETLFKAIDSFGESRDMLEALRPYLEGENAALETEKQAITKSPVYASHVAEEALAIRKARSLNASEFPELAWRGNLNKQSPDWSETFRGGNVSYSFAVVLKIPLFSGLSLASTWREKNNAQEAAALKSERDLVRFRSELQNDRSQIQSLRTQLEALELGREQNEEIVRLSLKSYELGKANLLKLLTAQDSLIEAKISLAQAKVDLAVLVRKFAWNIGAQTP